MLVRGKCILVRGRNTASDEVITPKWPAAALISFISFTMYRGAKSRYCPWLSSRKITGRNVLACRYNRCRARRAYWHFACSQAKCKLNMLLLFCPRNFLAKSKFRRWLCLFLDRHESLVYDNLPLQVKVIFIISIFESMITLYLYFSVTFIWYNTSNYHELQIR